MRHAATAAILILLAFLLLAGKACGQDSTQVVVGSLAAWDIEFHVIYGQDDYIQDLRNPYDENQRAIGVYDAGKLAAYYLWIHSMCYTALPSRHMGGPTVLVSPSSCRMYQFFSEQLWQLRAKIERKPLEAYIPPKKANGTDY